MFKFFMAIQVWLYRRSGGKMAGRMGRTQIILLSTTGRKSGQIRTLPLGLFDWPGGYLVVASNGGQPRHPAWYLNLMNNPHATVQVFDQVLPVTAEARARAWQQVITTAPSYAAYEKKTTRVIPLVLLRPTK
jgi:deazaflavin-dependent oxidoreductase (nitroreductase family)